MNLSFTIPTPRGDRRIGGDAPCFIIAEMSGNHNGNYETALEIVHAAAAAGADAIKLQTFKPETHTIDCDKPWFMERSDENPDIWKGKSLYQLYQEVYTPWEWHAPLKKLAEELGLVFFSAPGSPEAVDFLEDLDVPCHKVASYEATDTLLLQKLALTGKPLIISVGFASAEEIAYSVSFLRGAGVKDIVLLHCSTTYAHDPDAAAMNLRTMLDMKDRFGVISGFSDNNAGIEIPALAAAMGAAVIEKHVILDRSVGIDAQFSLTPDELGDLVRSVRRAEAVKGRVHYGPQNEREAGNLRFRRSLFVVQNVKKGDIFTAENVKSIRPSNGLPVRYFDDIMGKRASVDIERGTPLSWDLVRDV